MSEGRSLRRFLTRLAGICGPRRYSPFMSAEEIAPIFPRVRALADRNPVLSDLILFAVVLVGVGLLGSCPTFAPGSHPGRAAFLVFKTAADQARHLHLCVVV